MTDLADQFRVGRSTVGAFMLPTLKAIYETLYPIVMPQPTRGTWLEIAEGYWKRWNFPHCIGSVDGKYITIEVRVTFFIGSNLINNLLCSHHLVLVQLFIHIKDFTPQF